MLPLEREVIVEASDIVGLVLVVMALIGLQGLATWRVWSNDAYERSYKVAQTRVIWLLPLVGAVLVLMVHREMDRTRS
jgi:hypothetical protein